mgnify:CR=1 FL=1
MKPNILTISKDGRAHYYTSIRKASKVLSGTGSEDTKRSSIHRACKRGGGYVGDVWVQYSLYTHL